VDEGDMAAIVSVLPREGTQLVFLGGLPGLGKTHYAKPLEQQGWIFYDDFQSRAVGDSRLFRDSRYYAELVSHLRGGLRCIVSDIRVIHNEYRRDAEAALRQDVGNVPTELHLFENDPAQCAQNVRKAGDSRRMEQRIEAIEFWSKHYSAPRDAVIHPARRRLAARSRSNNL
jgi:hypothetical protein